MNICVKTDDGWEDWLCSWTENQGIDLKYTIKSLQDKWCAVSAPA